MTAGASDDADSFDAGPGGAEQGEYRGPPGDPPPAWDGENVAKRWKKFNRELLL